MVGEMGLGYIKLYVFSLIMNLLKERRKKLFMGKEEKKGKNDFDR